MTTPRAIYLGGDDKLLALVDEDDYDYYMRWRWHLSWHKRVFYARRQKTVADAHGRIVRRSIYLHREIAVRSVRVPRNADVDLLGHPIKLVVDHRSGHTLDCRRSNLRWCTHQENANNIPLTTRRWYGHRRRPVILGQHHDTAELILEYRDEHGNIIGTSGTGTASDYGIHH